jgi:hypothetical protein
LVVASAGSDEQGRNALKLVRIAAGARGVSISAMPATPFAPEIPHAEVTLDAVGVAPGDLLPGDGYDRYLKPFRTIEDIHVHAALLGYLASVARRFAWPRECLERIAAALVGTRSLALEPPSAPEVHVALAGLHASGQALLQELDAHWALVEPAERERWIRDRPLFEVAGSARNARRARAWERVTAEAPPPEQK